MVEVSARARGRAIWAIVAVLALAVGACSSGGGDASSASSGESTSAPAAVDRDGVVNVGMDLAQNGQFSLDPAKAVGPPSLDAVYALVYGRLLRKTDEGELVPGLAQSATVVDANTIDVTLHDGMTWQDGQPFTSQSVKDGLDYTLVSDNREGFGSAFFSLTSVEVTGPTTLKLHISDGTAASWFDTFISGMEASIVRPGSDFTKPVGAGPMTITSFIDSREIVLTRFDGYWDAANVGFGGMKLLHVAAAQPQASTNALQSGQLDVATLDVDQLPALSGDVESLTVSDPSRMVRVVPCKSEGPLSDARVRTALSKAIDRESLSDAVYEGTADPGSELWPEGHRFFTEDVEDVSSYDVEGAKQLLADAGYPDGFTFDLSTFNALAMPAVASVLEQQFAAIGVTAKINVTDDIVGQVLLPQAPGAVILPATPNTGLQKLEDYSGDSLGNVCSYDDPALNALISQLSRVSESTEEAVDLWDQINTKYADEALGFPLTFASNIGGYNSSRVTIGSVYPGGLFVFPDIYDSHMNS
jgi:peptide/nickel transport system substrate-binding protein